MLFFSLYFKILQFAKERSTSVFPPKVNIKDAEDITEDKVTNVLRRAIGFHSTLQADDGHWPGDYGGPMFLLPGLVSLIFSCSFFNICILYYGFKCKRIYLFV